MILPTNVNHPKFEVKEENILFQDARFSVAYSYYEDELRIGMRWNGEDEESDKGYPISRTRPSWMMFHDVLAIDFLKSMIGKNGAKDEQIIQAIHKLKINWRKKSEDMD